uniref:Ty3 transposon capsid-like protein domain-containing protein n=1 Tax=Nothobranchius furzeri TaxID=105023 RepID=A0A8C6LB05_NOTFU
MDTMLRQVHTQLTTPGPPSSETSTPGPAVSTPQALPGSAAQLCFRVADSPPPKTFSGEHCKSRGFLLHCRLAFERSPDSFVNDFAKISYIVGLLRGKALQWAETRSRQASFLQGPLTDFLADFNLHFGDVESQVELAKKILNLHQGRQTVTDYVIEFRTLAANFSGSLDMLKGAFVQALNDRIKYQLAYCQEPSTLEELISLAIRIDKRLRERSGSVSFASSAPHRAPSPPGTASSSPPGTTISSSRRAHATWTDSTDSGGTAATSKRGLMFLSWTGWSPGLQLPQPVKLTSLPVGSRLLVGGSSNNANPQCSLPCTIFYNHNSSVSCALLDSGCDQNLLDQSLVHSLKISTSLLPTPIQVSSLKGNSLTTITHQTVPVKFLVSGNHYEVTSFYVLPSPLSPVVLGHAWLSLHNPQVNWKTGQIEFWSPFCLSHCLQSASLTYPKPISSSVALPDLTKVPKEYHDLHQVFSKDRAASLPPHRPYDCSIDLLPGSTLPSSHLYNLSRPERECMEQYISESLATGIIRPSTSPLGAGFFFVPKKDGTLRPCIDYRGLNQITIKNKYPLPLLSSTFEPVQDATIFTKLNL